MITALTILDKSMNHIGFRQNYLSFTIAHTSLCPFLAYKIRYSKLKGSEVTYDQLWSCMAVSLSSNRFGFGIEMQANIALRQCC